MPGRVNTAGRHAACAHAVWRAIDCQRLGQADHAALGRTVFHSAAAGNAIHRPKIDNHAALLLKHLIEHRPAKINWRLEIDVHAPVEHL